ncbi:MAG: AAA family ATPase [Bacteroidota bacterium]
MSHIISDLHIKNYKSIIDHSFQFTNFTPLVGYNNAGKTTILESIKWILKKYSLDITCFNNSDHPIEMTAVIEGISEEVLENIEAQHRVRIEPFLVDEKLTVKRIQEIPGQGVPQIRLYVKKVNFAEGEDPWQLNPTGIDNAIKDLFPEPIHISGMENSEDDVSKYKASNTIGKLLGEIIGPIEEQYGAQVRGVFDGLKKLLDADGEDRAPELTTFDTQVNEKINAFFPDINIKVHVPSPELKEVFTRGTLKVYENGQGPGRDFSSLGHGAQRSIQMALIRHLADTKKAVGNSTTTTLLLVDEPELYLHPQAIEILRQSLKLLSTEGYQVIFTSHSPFMITQDDIKNTVLIRKDHRGTYKRNTLKYAVPQIEAEAAHQLTLMYSLSHSSSILFSEKVILVEGKTENKLLPAIIEKISGKSLGLHKCAMVQLGGSGSTKKGKQVLNVMDLPTKAIVDLDYAMTKGIKEGFLIDTDADIAACKSELANIAAANGIEIGTTGWPVGNATMSAAKGFAILAAQPVIQVNIENIKQKMLLHNIWIWKKGTIENHLDLQGKDEAIWASFNLDLQSNAIEVILPNDHLEITNCVNWLVN